MGPVPYENHVRFVLATHKKVRDIATAKVNGSPTVSVLLISGAIKSKVSALKKKPAHIQHRIQEVCELINAHMDILRKIQFHLQTCFEIGGGHTEIYHKIGIKIK